VDIPREHILRGPTSRPNIVYSVVEHDGHTEQTQAVCDLVAQKLQEYPSPAKIIIYSSNINAIKELGEALNCPTYYADVGSEAEKGRIQQQWESGRERVIVASNAFGLGIDRPDVRAVIHVGPIHQMKSYGQESGRAGRDGQRSEAIIMVGAGQQEALRRSSMSACNGREPPPKWPSPRRIRSVPNEKRSTDSSAAHDVGGSI
jgi:superfamily II DNA helicase RecQ